MAKSFDEVLAERPYLVIDSTMDGPPTTICANSVLGVIAKRAAGVFIMDLSKAAKNFAKLTGNKDRLFTVADLSVVAGVSLATINQWVDEGVVDCDVRPSSGQGKGKERKASWKMAFIAGTIGSLRRQGVKLESLKYLKELFVDISPSEKEMRNGKA